jgi:pimeloyl-ACP methyl ester carboxylesterase
MPKFVITVRAIANGAFGDGLGNKIRYLVIPDEASPLPTQEVTYKLWRAQVMASFPKDAAGAAQGDVVFFVHGFNESANDVAALHGTIARGLATAGFSPTLISFDWPSADKTYAYQEDVDVAARTAIDLVNAGVKPLLDAQTMNCKVAVHALCHSMGAFVLRAALDHADDGIATGSDWMLGQLVLVAGDVEASAFVDGNKDTESMLGHAYRLTNYFNRFDEALQISNVKHGGVEPRVGRVGLPPNAPLKTVNVDCTDRYKQVLGNGSLDHPIKTLEFSHGWYFSDTNFYADLAQTLLGAVDRIVVAGRKSGEGRTLNLEV